MVLPTVGEPRHLNQYYQNNTQHTRPQANPICVIPIKTPFTGDSRLSHTGNTNNHTLLEDFSDVTFFIFNQNTLQTIFSNEERK